MVLHKTSTTQGVWKGGIAFQRITKEFDIPPEVMNKGITAIIDWINESKSTIGKIALGGLILSALTAENSNPPMPISEKAELLKKEYLIPYLIPYGSLPYQGNIENESFEFIRIDSQKIISVPTSIIESVYRIGENHYMLKYLDGTKMQCDLITNPVLFHKRGSLFGDSKILKVKPNLIRYIDGTKYIEPPNFGEVANDIKALVNRSEKIAE